MALTAREMEMVQDTNVVAHIERQAEAIRAQAKAEGWSFFGVPSTHVAENYANVYEYERCMALGQFSDLHKEVYGFRPRGKTPEFITLSDVDVLINETLEQQDKMDRRHEDDHQVLEAWNAKQLNLAVDQLDENWDKYDALAEKLGY
jgi:hypothetical protein